MQLRRAFTRTAFGMGLAAMIAAAPALDRCSQPAFADSGNKCTSTANTSTCINIRGLRTTVDWITATHHNNHPSGPGKFELTGPEGLDQWSGMLPYAGGGNVQTQWDEHGRVMPEGNYCVQWFVNGDPKRPETGMACATVHK